MPRVKDLRVQYKKQNIVQVIRNRQRLFYEDSKEERINSSYRFRKHLRKEMPFVQNLELF